MLLNEDYAVCGNYAISPPPGILSLAQAYNPLLLFNYS